MTKSPTVFTRFLTGAEYACTAKQNDMKTKASGSSSRRDISRIADERPAEMDSDGDTLKFDERK